MGASQTRPHLPGFKLYHYFLEPAPRLFLHEHSGGPARGHLRFFDVGMSSRANTSAGSPKLRSETIFSFSLKLFDQKAWVGGALPAPGNREGWERSERVILRRARAMEPSEHQD